MQQRSFARLAVLVACSSGSGASRSLLEEVHGGWRMVARRIRERNNMELGLRGNKNQGNSGEAGVKSSRYSSHTDKNSPPPFWV